MKKRLNIVFFSVCFLAAVIAEAYFMQNGEKDLLSIAGMGAVLLILGYLWLDSFRSLLSLNYTQIVNLQKATYTATKKDTAEVTRQLAELQLRIKDLESNMINALQIITELQKKELEGQKNALNYEINYSKENTRQIIAAVQGSNSSVELRELLAKLGKQNNPADDLLWKEAQPAGTGDSMNPEITPLYDDPNKGLTTDEIASLFSSFGQ